MLPLYLNNSLYLIMQMPALFQQLTKLNKSSFYQGFYWLSLLLFSCFSIFAMGRTGERILAYGLWLFISLWVLKLLNNKGFIIYLWFVFLLSALYLPTAINYGELDIGAIISLYETNKAESLEFITELISLKTFFYLAIYIGLFTCVYRLNKYIKSSQNTKKIRYIFLFMVVLPIMHRPCSEIYKTQQVSLDTLGKIGYYPIRFISDMIYFNHKYFEHKQKLKAAQTLKATWQISKVDHNYKNYVLVIGESMRKDYMSAYGYPLDTTPFLANTHATVFNNYIAPGYNTGTSLQRMLLQNSPPENFIYSNNINSLANSAGMQTYWLSNQGQYGDYDILASSIGHQANEVVFLKKGEYSDKHTSDLQLLPPFIKMLQANHEHKLIVIHLMGSHSGFCNRLDSNYGINPINGVINKDISCYLTSIRQTDKLLEKIYHELQQQGDTFSLMYLSDHGLAHNKTDFKGITLLHNSEYKQNYDVPLIVLSSDDKTRQVINAQRSGFDFMSGLAEWLGIEEKSLTLKQPFFSDKTAHKVQVFNGVELVEYDTLKDDPTKIKD
ncbi:MAG: hypothetical protein CSA42_02545 [Gammaproteobacteria bacterium]|nr:MAG: hypothetical protein CSA42_02545 [Gammaproteobacteria bacterium]